MNLPRYSLAFGLLLSLSFGDAQADAQGTGTINSVDTEQDVVNITHGPIPELGWPEMTMDLPVADDVELDKLTAGDEVRFYVVLGDDQVYRMTNVEQAE